MKRRSHLAESPGSAHLGQAMSAFGAALARLALRTGTVLRRWREAEVRGPPGWGRGVVFVGRERLIERILSTIHNNSILLTGEKGIGKTAILLELGRRLQRMDDPTYRFFPVYIDLASIPEDRLFATAGEAILGEADRLHPEGFRENRSARGGGYGHRDLASDLRRVVRALSADRSRSVRLVLLVDSIDEVDTYHPRTTQRLRGLFMASVAENLVMVASATGISRRWDREGSPWYNFFEEIELDGLSCEGVQRLVAALTRGRMKFGDDVVERIAAATDGNPARIHAFCHALQQSLAAQGRRTATSADIDAIDTPRASRSRHPR